MWMFFAKLCEERDLIYDAFGNLLHWEMLLMRLMLFVHLIYMIGRNEIYTRLIEFIIKYAISPMVEVGRRSMSKESIFQLYSNNKSYDKIPEWYVVYKSV